jgi:DNA polymerase/3'-5' exonuclease PolX
MKLAQAQKIAEETVALLAPHCDRIAIAGSVRRLKQEPGDIEIVAIPRPYGVGLLESGVATVLDRWECIKGNLPCKYTQRKLPCGEVLDFFTAVPENWGIIFCIRTGPWEFSKRMVGTWLPRHGITCSEGFLWKDGRKLVVTMEEEVFDYAQIPYIRPEHRV